MWSKARAAVRIPQKYTPYSLRRGGATALFQWTGSFDVVADKGRWASLQALRLYVTTSLAELSLQEETNEMRLRWEAFARHWSK